MIAAPARGRVVERRRPTGRAVVVAAVVAALVLFLGAWLWLRDSSLVAVKRVEVRGLSGPDMGKIRGSLTAASRTMTTLDVKMDALHTAVRHFPIVKGLDVSTEFPNGMRIRVIEQVPIAVLTTGRHTVAVAADATLLTDVGPISQLPVISLKTRPDGARLTDPAARAQLAVLAAAPYPLLLRVAALNRAAEHGFVAVLRSGPSIYFGDRQQLAAKWRAAEAVLGAPQSAGASYIDVSVPDRPVAGVGGPAAAAAARALAAAGSPAFAGATGGTTGTSNSATAGTAGSANGGTAGSPTAGTP